MEDNNKIEHHVYDGIVEENNKMPSWWIWKFIFTVIFAGLYYIHFEFGGGPTLKDEYNDAMAALQKKIETAASYNGEETEEALETYMQIEANQQMGAGIYAEKCAMCHGANLEGKIGPNLVDNFWINGKGSRKDILHVVAKGSTAKGMPAWVSLLKADQLKNVTAYLFSKRGSNPKEAKAPEGAEVK